MTGDGPAPRDVLTLTAGAARCSVRADIGGSLAGWTIGDQPLLRPAPDNAGDCLDMASFPLVPYSNRIGHARFDWDGTAVALAPNFEPEPHALHGVGWRRPWTIADRGDSHVTLALHHGGDADWPWPFEATQRIMLREDRLSLSLSAINRHHAAVPLGFGHHPYFDATGATLSFTASRVFPSDASSLPMDPVAPHGAFDFSGGAAVTGRTIDNCFSGWDGNAIIRWADRSIGVAITASPELAAMVLYIPDGGRFFCVEPVPNINNALNRPGDKPGLPVIAPGAAFTADITLCAVGR